MGEPMTAEKLQYTNIFDAICDEPEVAADMEFRADMILVIRDIIISNGWEPREIAERLGLRQPRVSELMNGKVKLFSSDKLIGLLAQLGYRFKPQYEPTRQQPLKVKVRHAA